MKKDPKRFSKGIHIEKLDKNKLKTILKDYYNLNFFPEFDTWGKKDLKAIYLNALSTILLNGYYIPINHSNPVDPFMYFNDMIMMLYLYTINDNKYIASNQLSLSPQSQANVGIIEQSGFGAILGFRRKNANTKNFNTHNAESQKQVRQKVVMVEHTKENNVANVANQVIIRGEHTKKFEIPFVCKNTVETLIKSRKYNPYLFELSKDMSKSFDTAISPTDQLRNHIRKIFNIGTDFDDPLEIFTDKLKEALKFLEDNEQPVSANLYNYMEDKNIDNYSKFYERYYELLNDVRQNDENEQYSEQADYYLSELLFAHQYYIDTMEYLETKSQSTNIDETVKENFLDLVYIVSESMLCFSRKEHINLYWQLLFDHSENNKKKSLNRIKKFKKIEKYTAQKFAPALYYCFLYYTIDEANKASSSLTNKPFVHELEQLITASEKELAKLSPPKKKLLDSNEDMKSLLLKKKK